MVIYFDGVRLFNLFFNLFDLKFQFDVLILYHPFEIPLPTICDYKYMKMISLEDNRDVD